MDGEELISLYEVVSRITGQMVCAARSGDWEQLAQLEADCSNQVESIKRAEHPNPVLSAAARAKKGKIIRKILDDDRQIRDITQPWMARLSAMMNSAGAERKLSQAYGPGQSG